MNITHYNGFILSIYIYDKEVALYCVAKGNGMEVGVIKHSKEFDHQELVNEAIEQFCLQWVSKYKHSNIMIRKWVVTEQHPNEYIAISL